ncbi:hypothetical protein HMI55_003425 [Coelomomyces lativittatus]|nr:hypothetical protein HMI55_003425 [Coelomomyces lativittatus]
MTIKSKITHQFEMGDFKGFAGKFSTDVVNSLRDRPEVDFVEEDALSYIQGQQMNAPWGLTRIGQRLSNPKGPYVYPDNQGQGVTAYVMDTGVNVKHIEFEGRATIGYTACGSYCPSDDVDGHGTHVAGTIAGRSVGVAKKAKIVSVKVLHKGSGMNSEIIAGINWIVNEVKKNRNKKNIVNMSLGGGYSRALNAAVEAAVASGVNFAIAAGNENTNACEMSPASSRGAIIVGATNPDDSRASFSNYGRCVTLFAPGSNIRSSWYTGEYNSISGTSMASPHVAGAVALLLSDNGSLEPSQVYKSILNMATAKIVFNSLSPSTSLLYIGDIGKKFNRRRVQKVSELKKEKVSKVLSNEKDGDKLNLLENKNATKKAKTEESKNSSKTNKSGNAITNRII